MMVVDVGASEVKIEAIMNNFVQLQKIQNPHDDNVDVELSDSGGEEDAADTDDDDGEAGDDLILSQELLGPLRYFGADFARDGDPIDDYGGH
jgi:hypothetical protein